MYFPYLRGKQFELIALRELIDVIVGSGNIHSIIEPVRNSTSTLNITLNQLIENEIPFSFIINPTVGDFTDDYEAVINIINENLSNYDNYQIGVLVESSTDFDLVQGLIDNVDNNNQLLIIHRSRHPDSARLEQFVNDNDVKFNLVNETIPLRRYRRIIEPDTKIILDDAFNSKSTNASYADTPDEFFSEEYLFYEEDGFVGFSDYLTIGNDYSDSGFAPYAVAIHLTYLNENGQIWIRHFVSDSNDDYSDVAGTYREALEKLIEFIENENINSIACTNFRNQFNTGHYPGLGSVKKLSIMHHIELVSGLLQE